MAFVQCNMVLVIVAALYLVLACNSQETTETVTRVPFTDNELANSTGTDYEIENASPFNSPIVTTPYWCGKNTTWQCGFQRYETRGLYRVLTDFVRYCHCPDGTECSRMSDNDELEYYYYRCYNITEGTTSNPATDLTGGEMQSQETTSYPATDLSASEMQSHETSSYPATDLSGGEMQSRENNVEATEDSLVESRREQNVTDSVFPNSSPALQNRVGNFERAEL